jgi:hypothetical protein
MAEPVRIPMRLLLLDVVGALVTGLGFYGVIEPAAATKLPFLASPGVAVALVVIGIGLMGYALGGILANVRRAARAARDASARQGQR